MLPANSHSLLPLIHTANNVTFPCGQFDQASVSCQGRTRSKAGEKFDEERLLPFFLAPPASFGSRPLGLLRPDVAQALQADGLDQFDSVGRSPWYFLTEPIQRDSAPAQAQAWGVSFAPWVNESGQSARSECVERLVKAWKDAGMFPDILRGDFH